MPTINLDKKYKRKSKKNSEKSKLLNHIYVYNTKRWRDLRLWFLQNNPLCERCKKDGKLNSAIDVHHIIPISTVDTITEKQELGFDINNLEGLCKEHHKEEHAKKNNAATFIIEDMFK
jgi:5-methylcytosine-specific restriction endonuclease McrA